MQVGNLKGYTYFDLLSQFGIGGAHPGGILLTKELLSTENIHAESHILDAGCGTGQTSAFIYNQYGANVYGLDINSIMIKKAKNRFALQQLPIHLVHGSVESIPFKDETFDMVLSESVLAFVDKIKSLKEFNRVLKTGGRIIANEMTINHPLRINEQNEIKKFYGLDSILLEDDWKQLFENAGFENIEIKMGNQSFENENQLPEFHFSENIEPALFDILNKHAAILIQYQDLLSYRIITGIKK